ncbi:exodeoxyribonuclease V alpha subunit [Weissella uvarum]|uniref:SF1B family DNA helicase RecD2 n=1 Tax=Weissella uvarum TaxID=1479233 RepID=UPI0019614163|nr:ATP-dependent RecD-like DNA helicase [Weissella uvarum]MBM7617780.1 exodeoxyribonuclease V alpha subunit [Weissella uvarum]MCM0595841.1 ATP-dependent RecD-like DNA helicase [Weissella uvarum]
MSLQQNPTTEAAQLVGTVEHVIFSAQDSFYKVLNVQIDDTNFDFDADEITVTGNFGDIQTGATYEFSGRITTHARYGEQFLAEKYQRQAATSTKGVIEYLSSERFPGVGKASATKIVDELGVNAVDKILDDEHVLDSLQLPKRVQETLVKRLSESEGVERAILSLNEYGFSTNLASEIYEKYQSKTLTILEQNPYQLVADINGVSFKRMDEIALDQGIPANDERRIQAAVLDTMNTATFESGDTYMLVADLLRGTQQLLEQSQNQPISSDLIQTALLKLTQAGLIVAEGEHLYIKPIYDAERTIAEKLLRLTHLKTAHFTRKQVVEKLKIVAKQNTFEYDENQTEAIISALTSNLFILTGGPGTGKTTILNGIVKTFKLLEQSDGFKQDEISNSILLAAPTGRAAKRLSEATGMPASTIHRLLGITGRESRDELEIEELEGKILIVDEMSMVDTELFALLLSAVPMGMQLILVGDKDQLPSVGPGRVFYDILASGLLNYRELDVIYRQGKGSSIIALAQAVKSGQLPADFQVQQSDRSFFNADVQTIPKLIRKIGESWRDKGFSVADMQILSPMYKTGAGVHQLNTLAQDIFNPASPKKRELPIKMGDQSYILRVGDKVMQTSNNPENNVFNGDIGYIKSILLAKDADNPDKKDKVSVAFDTGDVDYGRQDLNQLALAYATTIHKAQGSEYKLVIMPMVRQFSRMLQRNLLYTGLTRASESLVLLGEPAAFAQAAQNEGTMRKTTLQERLKQQGSLKETGQQAPVAQIQSENEKAIKPKADETVAAKTPDDDKLLTTAMIQAGTIDPNIGMAGLTPVDFES